MLLENITKEHKIDSMGKLQTTDIFVDLMPLHTTHAFFAVEKK